MIATKVLVRHHCARCLKNQRREALIFSTFTRLYYCTDFKACDRRVKRAQR